MAAAQKTMRLSSTIVILHVLLLLMWMSVSMCTHSTTLSLYQQHDEIIILEQQLYQSNLPRRISEDIDCPAGYYCPEGQNKTIACIPSQYCPSNSTVWRVCQKGYYCPTPDKAIECPKGSFCLAGSVHPKKCFFFLSRCPAGSKENSLHAAGAVFIVLLLVAVLIIYFIFILCSFIKRRRHKKRLLSSLKKTQIDKSATVNEPVDLELNKQEIALDISEPQATTSVIIEPPSQPPILKSPDNFYIDLKFENIGFKLRTKRRTILEDVSGEMRHGELTAVMGCSGAGKSTLIATLAGRNYHGKVTGTLYVNGHKVRNLNKFGSRIGFVPQDDIMIRECTVEETLFFSARTRLNWRKTRKEIWQIVNDVITVLGLETVRYSVIGDENKRGISGGERKRVSVGIELVTQPLILFLDEPTSGLDATCAKEVAAALKNIARSGIAVICVIHQPRYEVFEMFDSLLLLGPKGRTVYMGEVSLVQQYFEDLGYSFPAKSNIADVILDFTSGGYPRANQQSPQQQEQQQQPIDVIDLSESLSETSITRNDVDYLPEMWERNQKTHDTLKTASVPPTEPYKREYKPYFTQFWMCMARSFIQQLRSIKSLFIDIALVFISGLFIALMYKGERYVGPPPPETYKKCPLELMGRCSAPTSNPIMVQSSFIALALSLIGTMAGLRTFGREKVVFKKESQTGLSAILYFWAKDISMLPACWLTVMIFLGIWYSTIASIAPVYEYLYPAFLTYWISFGVGYVVSIIMAPHLAQLAGVVIIFIFNILCGLNPSLSQFDDMGITFLPYLSFMRYSLELLYLNEMWYYKDIYDISSSVEGNSYAFSDTTMCWAAMLGYGFAIRLIANTLLILTKPNSLFARCWRIRWMFWDLFFTTLSTQPNEEPSPKCTNLTPSGPGVSTSNE